MSNAATAAKPARPSSKPIAKRQLGNISVSVFTHDMSRADGTTFPVKDFILQKSYKDLNGDWQTQSVTLKPREIFAVQQALALAFVESFDKLSNDEE